MWMKDHDGGDQLVRCAGEGEQLRASGFGGPWFAEDAALEGDELISAEDEGVGLDVGEALGLGEGKGLGQVGWRGVVEGEFERLFVEQRGAGLEG